MREVVNESGEEGRREESETRNLRSGEEKGEKDEGAKKGKVDWSEDVKEGKAIETEAKKEERR